MRLYSETLLVYKTILKWDIEYVQYWDTNYLDRWMSEKIMEFIRIGRKGDPLPLVKPLIIISPPRIVGISKRELWNIIDEEVKKKRAYLDRIGEKIAKQLKVFILTWEIYYKSKEEKPLNDTYVWARVPRRTKFWLNLLFGDDLDDEKPP